MSKPNRTRRAAALVATIAVVWAAVIALAVWSTPSEADDHADPAPETTSSTAEPEPTPEGIALQRISAMSEDELQQFDRYLHPTPTTTTTTTTTAPPSTTTTAAPAPTPSPAPAQPSGSVWDQLAHCEASGNWAHPPVGSYGYSGGLMFLPSTWRAYGGGEFAPQAYQASRDAQIVVAERILASHGGSYRAWPGCRKKLNLP